MGAGAEGAAVEKAFEKASERRARSPSMLQVPGMVSLVIKTSRSPSLPARAPGPPRFGLASPRTNSNVPLTALFASSTLARLPKTADASGESLASNMDLEAGVDTIKRNMKSASFAKGSYSSMVKRNPILATFMVDREGRYCMRAMHKGCSFFGAFLIVLGLVAGLVLMPMAFSNAKQNMLIVKPSDPCFEEGLCPEPLKVNIFMFNITNPEEYMAGAQPPKQEELGPFVFEIGQRNYNASFNDDLTEVDYTSAMFASYLPEESCPSCEEDSIIVGPNLGYLAVLH